MYTVLYIYLYLLFLCSLCQTFFYALKTFAHHVREVQIKVGKTYIKGLYQNTKYSPNEKFPISFRLFSMESGHSWLFFTNYNL